MFSMNRGAPVWTRGNLSVGPGGRLATENVIDFERSASPVASIIVLAWRSAPHLLNCLSSLQHAVARTSSEVVLVLNEPEADLLAEVETRVRGAVVVKSRVNLGFGGGINLGVRHSIGEYVVLLNDDTEVDVDWLETMIETAERRPTAGAVGGTSMFFDGTIQEAGNIVWADGSTVKVGRDLPAGSAKYDYERRVDYCGGSSLLVRRECWDRLGGLDAELYYPAYYEDTDLCLRLTTELGLEVWYQPLSILRHHESAATNSSFRAFLFHRNRSLFIKRWSEFLATRDLAAPEDPKAVEAAAWRASGARPRVLLIDDQVADPSIGSGYPRMMETIRQLVLDGFQLSIFTSLVDGAHHNNEMRRLGVQVLDGYTEEDLADALESTFAPFDLVLVSRPHNFERFASVVRDTMPDSPIVYDAEALFHRRIERQAALELDEVAQANLRAEAEAMRDTEAEIAREADGLISISEEEAGFLSTYSTAPVLVHGPLLGGIEASPADFGERADIGFVAGWGGGAKSPNVDALSWFAHQVLPKILARVPRARLLVTGVRPPAEARRLASPSIVFLGAVEELSDLYGSIRVVIVPMRYGAGVKIKTVEAMQYGVPTVSTTVGAEGMPIDVPDALLVDDDPEGFALKVATLLDEENTWKLQRARVLHQLDRWDPGASIWPGVFAAARERHLERFGVTSLSVAGSHGAEPTADQ
jgi:O-antigen biosynthesis protein